MWVGGATDSFSEKKFRGRIRFISYLFIGFYFFITSRLFFLQIVKGGELAQASESNRTQIIALRAPRGEFLDRFGNVIVQNRPSWSLLYSVPEKITIDREMVQKYLNPFSQSFPNYWEKRLQRAFETKQMVRLAEDISDDTAFVMRELEQLVPGLRVVMEFRRGYPVGNLATHIIGYLGEINERELRNVNYTERKSGDLIGKMGLEKIFDKKIRGQDGGMLIEVDSIGRLKKVIEELPFLRGGSVILTLDLNLQKVAEEELAKTTTKRGAAVAIDLNTGAILAWASQPTINALGSLGDELKDPNKPFLDRVYRGSYPPGSVFKIITAIAGFEKNAINLNEKIYCPGYLNLKDKNGKERRYGCWKIHGTVDFWKAMTESCDTYFYELGKKIGSQEIANHAFEFGFGQQVQGILPGENKGVLPSPLWKRKIGLGGWSTGDTLNTSIGQGFITATPLQVCVMMAVMANRGVVHRPYIVDRIIGPQGEILLKEEMSVIRTVQLKDNTWTLVNESLKNVVTQGTGVATKIDGLDIRGKTGTAQNPQGDDHAWFSVFAGYHGEKPSIALCVFVENGGHGGAVAAPIAKKILETALPPKNLSIKS
ncbi:MAG: penicillin-binding protein 2 [Elusimicrobiota bacterium]